MNEAKFRSEVGRLIRAAGWWDLTGRDAIICPRCKTKILPKKGRPDTICPNPNRFGFVIEYKMYENLKEGKLWEQVPAFAFSEIEPEQRVWLTVWDSYAKRDPSIGIKRGGAYIGLGIRHGTAGAKNKPRKGWVIPWQSWLWVEDRLREAGQASLPLVAGKGMNKLVQANHLDAVTQLAPWELAHVQNVGWRFPNLHPLYPPQGEYLNLAQLTQRWEDARVEQEGK